jgi:hypothetical protein
MATCLFLAFTFELGNFARAIVLKRAFYFALQMKKRERVEGIIIPEPNTLTFTLITENIFRGDNN